MNQKRTHVYAIVTSDNQGELMWAQDESHARRLAEQEIDDGKRKAWVFRLVAEASRTVEVVGIDPEE